MSKVSRDLIPTVVALQRCWLGRPALVSQFLATDLFSLFDGLSVWGHPPLIGGGNVTFFLRYDRRSHVTSLYACTLFRLEPRALPLHSCPISFLMSHCLALLCTALHCLFSLLSLTSWFPSRRSCFLDTSFHFTRTCDSTRRVFVDTNLTSFTRRNSTQPPAYLYISSRTTRDQA